MSDRFLTIDEVAERYRTSVNTVRYWRHRGVGPKCAVYGRRVLYRESDLIAWEREQESRESEAV